ncbi:MAG: hypothetical protein K2I42_05210, partial [Anaeroplasmataceae bacterium]|nr:hypothetical protein [Anaeroplasmataceae bacterium]
FTCDETKEFQLKKMNIKFQFKDWTLNIKKIEQDQLSLIEMEIKKDSNYKIIFIPTIEQNNEQFFKIKEFYFADEYIICRPYHMIGNQECFISISNIESFRRIQQIILRTMIYTDEKRVECPFCNHQLTQVKQEEEISSFYICPSCRTEIHQGFCSTEKKKYFYTRIANLPKNRVREEDYAKEDRWLYRQKAEGQMFYRNITKLTNDGEEICPHCKQVHRT